MKTKENTSAKLTALQVYDVLFDECKNSLDRVLIAEIIRKENAGSLNNVPHDVVYEKIENYYSWIK